jgi:hypothetical protein
MQAGGRFEALSVCLAEKETPLPINRYQVNPNVRLNGVEKNISALAEN